MISICREVFHRDRVLSYHNVASDKEGGKAGQRNKYLSMGGKPKSEDIERLSPN